MRFHRILGVTFALLIGTLLARPDALADGVADPWRDQSPHKSDFVSVNGVRLHYLDWGGDGPPLLMLAGLFGSAHGFDEIAPALAKDFRVIALTRRGHGKSDSPATGYALDVLVEDIRQFLDVLQLKRVFIAGVSAGGVEAALVAARYPERVDGVVYLDSAYDHSAAFAQKWAGRLAQAIRSGTRGFHFRPPATASPTRPFGRGTSATSVRGARPSRPTPARCTSTPTAA